jgi:hypothetical protein
MLILERQLQHRLVDEPALLASDLKRENLVGVVVNGEALGLPRREVRVCLRGVAELALERPAELRQRRPGEMQGLENQRRARLERIQYAADLGRAAEGNRPPGQALRVGADLELLGGLDQAEGGVAQPAGADEPLDVGDRKEVVETTLPVPRGDERLPLPVLGEELLGRDRVDRTR